jgi:membrane-associated phospholipid phosphatase
MTRRATPLLASLPLACALIVSPAIVGAQTLAPQQVNPGQLDRVPPDFTPDLGKAVAAEAAKADFVPSVGQLFKKTFTEDFRRLPSLDSAVILGLGGLASTLGHSSDSRIANDVPASSSSAWTVGNMYGSMYVQLGGAFAAYSLGRASGNTKMAALGADLVSAQLVTQTMTQGIKFAVGRTRPDGTSYSFPSGHTASAFATAAVLQRDLGWKFGIPAYAAAAFVGASRIESQRHYLSDVAFGAALGMVAGRTVTIGRGNARFAVAPAAAPGGGGVNFTWVGKK